MKLKDIIANFGRKDLYYRINQAPDLEDYQKVDTCEILKIIYRYFREPKEITILDIGCSAAEAKYLAEHVKSVVGININKHYFRVKTRPKNMELLTMDGTQLAFPDNYFDFVYSINLYEHIGNLSKCIDEQLRVLKKGGYCYARWDPIWSGPKGHHIHEDMVKDWWDKYFRNETYSFRDDSQFITDWSHLLLSKDEMFNVLLPKIKNAGLTKHIVEYIYDSKDINRLFFDEVAKILSNKKIRIISWDKYNITVPPGILKDLKKIHNCNYFSACNSQLLFTHALDS